MAFKEALWAEVLIAIFTQILLWNLVFCTSLNALPLHFSKFLANLLKIAIPVEFAEVVYSASLRAATLRSNLDAGAAKACHTLGAAPDLFSHKIFPANHALDLVRVSSVTCSNCALFAIVDHHFA